MLDEGNVAAKELVRVRLREWENPNSDRNVKVREYDGFLKLESWPIFGDLLIY